MLSDTSLTSPVRSDGDAGWNLHHSYTGLPEILFTPIAPTPVSAPRLVVLNRSLASDLGLNAEALDGNVGAAIFSGNRLPEGAAPLAQAYAGHQYGGFNVLGDGRAILLGEQTTADGKRYDVQLKGSGPTPYSRQGDGRAALGPMLREYIISEAMAALGISTTRSLAVAETGERILRQDGMLRGAVLTRIASSHIRVGTFQWAAAAGGEPVLKELLDYTIRRHYPDLTGSENPALALLKAVIERQAKLVAQWMHVGFVHGVLNTDNVALSGETIDYGPCAFMDAYDIAAVFSSIDRHGRYAYGNQPTITQWNLTRFAETLLSELDSDEETAIAIATEALKGFESIFQTHWLAGMRRKLGIFNEEDNDVALFEELLDWMQETGQDYTNTFAALSQPDPQIGSGDNRFSKWSDKWKARLDRQSQSSVESEQLRRDSNPAFIPRNHLVEAALASAEQDDLGPMERLLEILAKPFDHSRQVAEYQQPDLSGESYRTFCGT